jgi:hypothetical protein
VRVGRRAWPAAVLVVAVVGLLPVLADRDSFPLSTLPMFSADLPAVQPIDTVVGVRGDGSEVPLDPDRIAGTDVVNQAAAVVSSAITSGAAATLCAAVARRAAAAGLDGVVALEVVTEHYDAVRWFDGDHRPVGRDVHARCPLPAAS